MEKTLGAKMENLIAKEDIQDIVAARVRAELTTGEVNGVVQDMTDELIMAANLCYYRRKEDMEKSIREKYEHDMMDVREKCQHDLKTMEQQCREDKKGLKERLWQSEMKEERMYGKLAYYEKKAADELAGEKRGRKPRTKKENVPPPPPPLAAHGGKQLPYGVKAPKPPTEENKTLD
jgi:hypothetical protein